MYLGRALFTVFSLFLIILIQGCDGSSERMLLNSRTIIYHSSDEPLPIQKAVQDLASDMQIVFGKEVEVTSDLADCSSNCIIISSKESLPFKLEIPERQEVFVHKVLDNPSERIKKALVLSGSDIRGVIYSIYDFSERYLGVDPLYWWTDHEPARLPFIRLPRNLDYKSSQPTIRYRGLFINDEDLLTGWKPGTWNINGIDLEVWDRLYEALLRLKGNMIVPGTFIFPYEPQVAAAGARGLIITQHHAEPLGLNVYRWPEEVPYSFQGHRDKLMAAWTKTVEQYPDEMEVLWTVGYRGRHDRAFWSDQQNAPKTKKARAGIIQDAIQTQIKIVKARRKNPQFIMNSWGEGLEFIQEGLLNVPDQVTTVWADGGWGIIRDNGKMGHGDGIYYHVAMFNHKSNQLTEMIPIQRIQSELIRAISTGANSYFLLNTSDFRPVMMSTKAALSIAYDASSWMNDSTYYKKYIRDWSQQQFGEKHSDQISDIYSRYYTSPAKYGPDETYRMGDNYYTRMSRLYLRRMETGDSSTYIEKVDPNKSPEENAQFLVDICEAASHRWEELYEDAKTIKSAVPADRKSFFQTNVILPLEIHQNGNEMLIAVMSAYLGSDERTRTAHLKTAIHKVQRVLEAFEKAETGKWQNFYQNDFMTGFRSTAKCLELTLKKCQGIPTYENISSYVNDWSLWDQVKAYQGNQRVPM